MPERVCTVDFESRSYLNIKDCGAWRYAEDKTTEILCMAYKFDAEDSELWVPGIPFPQSVLDHIEANGMFEAHNVQFERAMWVFILCRQMGIPVPRRWRDTLAVCAYRGLPLSLDAVGAENCLNLGIKKDKLGKYLLNTLCTPKWGTKTEPDRIYREDWDLTMQLYDYCLQDDDAEHFLSQAVGVLPEQEYRIWILDQKINQRGVAVDIDAVEAALDIIDEITTRLNAKLFDVTDGKVQKATQRQKMMDFCSDNGVALPDLTKGTVSDFLQCDKDGRYLLQDEVPDKVLQAVAIRQQLAKSSTNKLIRMKDSVSKDGRLRGMLQYHGAQTGRWAGRLVQPHNFPRASITNSVSDDGKKKWLDMEKLVADIRNGSVIDYPQPMEAIASSLRGMFIAEPGKVLRVCDFSAIEARVTFWAAGCEKGLQVFHLSDRGESEDIYCVTASGLVGFTVTKKDNPDERQLGKITILGCGYQMGAPRLQEQAIMDYKVDLSPEEAKGMVDYYRSEYSEVVDLWYGLNETAIVTVETGKAHFYKDIAYEFIIDNAGRWLACLLPNGRRIWYHEPYVVWETPSWGGRKRPGIHYQGRDNKKGGSWGEVRTYGGMLTENVVQAIARDMMVEAMIRVEGEGYRINLTVHDEIISHDEASFGSQKEFERLMSISPSWAPDCPIAVEGGEITRYQKI